MFKKIYENLSNTENRVINCIKEFMTNNRSYEEKLYDKVSWMSQQHREKDNYLRVIDSQQRTIEQLTKALCDKYEHGLCICSEEGRIPMVIRNGKELTSKLTSSFSIDCTTGEFPNIQFEQIGGTAFDMAE